MSRAWPLLLAALLASACGGAVQDGAAQNGAAEDEVLTRLAGSATRALELDQPQSAAQLYARALARARERDDAARMDDMAFGQATAALAQGDAGAALAVTQEVRTELSRRGRAASPRLLLAEATALQRLGRAAEAGSRAREVTQRAAEDRAAGLRAWFLLGLLAAARGDVADLATARAALAGSEDPAFVADTVELDAHLALLRGDARASATQAGAAATLRQEALDYRGLSRALALEGRARARLGQGAAAADLLLRAGQGAATRGEVADARAWLAEAARLASAAGRPALAAEARRAGAGLRPGP